MLPPRILIIEDEIVLAKNMKTYFSYVSGGVSDVRTAADAAQALEILESFKPDALVLDYLLPDIDGLKLYAEIIRRQGRKINCVMITGNPSEQLTLDSRDLGINQIIRKPFRFSDLQLRLEAFKPAPGSVAPDANE